MVCDIGAILAGGISTGLYLTLLDSAFEHVANESRLQIIICEDETLVNRVLALKHIIPSLKWIVQWSGEKVADKRVLDFEALLSEGAKIGDDEGLKQRLEGLEPNKCSNLVYTSGTTGAPKGVMLSHDNLVYTARVFNDVLFGRNPQEQVKVSYIPLCQASGKPSFTALPA